MLNDIRVENSFIKTAYSNWKHARSTDKGFHQNPETFTNKLPKDWQSKSTEDVSEMINSNSTEVKSQNRASLIKIVKDYLYVEMEMIKILISNNS